MPKLTQLQTVQLHAILADALQSLPNDLVEYKDAGISDRTTAEAMGISVNSVIHMRHTLFGRLENTSAERIESMEKRLTNLATEVAYLYDFLRIKSGVHKP